MVQGSYEVKKKMISNGNYFIFFSRKERREGSYGRSICKMLYLQTKVAIEEAYSLNSCQTDRRNTSFGKIPH